MIDHGLEGFRLSPQQQRVWRSQRESAAHLAQCVVAIEGPLHFATLQHAVQAVVDRHEILRTRYVRSAGIKLPFQVVAETADPTWEVHDWTKLAPSQQTTEIDRFLDCQRRRQVDIENKPLLLFALIGLAEQYSALVVCLPRLSADSATLDNLLREIGRAYDAGAANREEEGDAMQYADYSAWLEEAGSAGDDAALAGIAYWRARNHARESAALPFQYGLHERERNEAEDRCELEKTGGERERGIPLEALDRAAGRENASACDFLFACYQALIGRLAGSRQFVSAVRLPCRAQEELQDAFGVFSRWASILTNLGDDTPFRTLLARSQEATREAERWQDYFVDDDELPECAIGFEYEMSPQSIDAGAVSFSLISRHLSEERFTLRLSCRATRDGLAATWFYDARRLAREDVERVAGHFQAIVECAIHDAGTTADRLSLLTADQREQILVGFNDALLRTRRDAAPECIHESFEEQAARTPHRVALVCDDRQFTYGELDARATQLARYLEWLGVEPDTCVVICMGRSSDIVLAILSVLKAGGAYVPLDPGLPADRVKSILNDARPRAVLTLSAVRHELPDHDAPVVCLDADWPLISTTRSDASLGRRASGANLAYVLFTSGSTGIPKGVAVEHRQLVNYVDSVSEALDLPSGASYACVSTFAADLGNTVIFPALCSGGTLHVISQDRVTDADAFADYFSRHSIDCLKIVPSHLQALLTTPCPERALPKRRLVLGGEASSWSLITKVHELAPECLVFNHYGPTETTVGACTYRITAADAFNERTASVPIGRPIANVRVHVLDSDLEPVPIWMPGEIYIGGAGLARGYLNRPDLTAESFIPNPFEPGLRLYRTGDLGRYLPNGSIQFLGRTDHQVKIRGFRIELGEIENVLAQHRSVRQAIVLVREDVPGEKQIAACVVAEDPGTLRPEEIRDFVKSKVPEHMVPSMFFVLDAWPLTRNGKVDRSRLLQLQQQPQRTETASRRPATPLESTLLTIFSEVLRREAVDVDSNFFDIGGHSLLAVQVLSRIRRALNVTLPVRVLFETPTVEGIAAAIAAASDTASASESTLEPGGAQAPSGEAARIPRRKADDPVPLSYTQEQMWFIDQLAPSSASYNMACAFQLKGLLNIAALERAFNEIVRRHESLRTTFDSVEGVPMQVIAPSLTIALPVITVPAHSGTGSTDAAIRLAGEHARQPFDLAKGPLLRCRLWKVPGEEHLLVIALHHIVNDGWSWSVLFSELSALYEAYSEERQAALPESPIQYGDFARWESERLRQDLLATRLEYWSRQLENAPTLLDLPTDRPRAAVQSFRGTVHSETFPLELKEQLEALSREHGATLFMTLGAAFNALLFRWTGQDDIVVGTTIAGRNRPELEPLIGLFINTLVLRTDLSGNPTFHELLQRFREVALEAYANQEVPFDKIIERLHSKRSLSHGTLFQVLFVLHQGTSQQDLSLAGLRVERIPVETGAVKFDLSVSMVDKPGGLSCAITYRTDLFDAATIRRLTDQFQRLLRGVAQDPSLRLSQLPLLSAPERHQMLVTWNDTKREYPADDCIHELFERQVSRTPDACAVMLESVVLTYRELNDRATVVADRLHEAGVQPGSRVVICIDRSIEMLVGVLAILKAGCAYVPLDSQHSLNRLTSVLDETGSPVLLTGTRLAQTLSGVRETREALRVICLDDPVLIEKRRPIAQPASVRVTADDLAYVIYTSGSTGTPKGVEIAHRSLVNFARASAESFSLRPADRVLQFATLSFDTAAEEIFPCLITGATLVLRSDRILDSASAFLNQCRRWRITVLDLPTVYWHALTENVAAGNLDLPETLRLVILGGDRALPERAVQWQRVSKGRVRLLNEYGPTEATVVATTHDVADLELVTEAREVPIGRPIANVQTYVLDPALNPVPIGARGELYIGGAGVARGYHRRPDLTAESFIPDPFGQTPGARLYRTGDLARYLPDGSLEFLGRTDHLVKVRGFRVEPGEVEAVLTEHAAVRHAVVVTRREPTGDHRLIAYVVPASGLQLNAQALRAFLKGRLPEYMVPAAFVFLDALPLTSHGKVDRRALPEPDPGRLESHQTFVAARTPLEQELVHEWETLLATRPIGIRDNFFELGGHSLLAVRLTARIEKRLGRATSVAALFESPTIEQLAVRLELPPPPKSWSLMAIQPNGSRRPFFWVHGDHSFAVLPDYLGPDQPLYGFDHLSQDGHPAPHTRVEDFAAHYLRQVRSVDARGPYLLGGYSFGAVVAFEMAQQLRSAGEQVDVLFLLDPPGRDLVDTSAPVTDVVRRHLRHMASRNVSGIFEYLWPRIKDRLDLNIGAQVVTRVNALRVKFCLSMGRRLPPSLRAPYILGIYAQALRAYVPQRYAGPVTLTKANEAPYKPRLDWAKLTTPEPRIQHVNGSHRDLTMEPQVGQWAESLKELLDRRHLTRNTMENRVAQDVVNESFDANQSVALNDSRPTEIFLEEFQRRTVAR